MSLCQYLGGFLHCFNHCSRRSSNSAKTRLSACIFLLLLQKSRSASPHVEGCCCTILAIKRIPLLSCAAFSGCHGWHPLNMSLHVANSLLTNTTAIRGGSECVPPCTRLNFEFASQIRS